MTESNMPPNGEWRIGDVVEAFGVRGKITDISSSETYLINVYFDSVLREDAFTEDGRCYDWHALPSLRFISREKKKVKKTVTRWVNVFIPEKHEEIWREKEDADRWGNERIACVELKGEYEMEE